MSQEKGGEFTSEKEQESPRQQERSSDGKDQMASPSKRPKRSKKETINLAESEDDDETFLRPRPRGRPPGAKNKPKEKGEVSKRKTGRKEKRKRIEVWSSSEDEEFDLDTPIVVRLSDQSSPIKAERSRPPKKPRRMSDLLEEKETDDGEKRIALQQKRNHILRKFHIDLKTFETYLKEGKRVRGSYEHLGMLD